MDDPERHGIAFVLDRLPGSVVMCVDTWRGADDQVGQAAADVLAEIEARFDHNMRPYSDRVVKWNGTCQPYVAACSLWKCFDPVSILGSHRADDVLVDAIRGFEALWPGGVIICDDYLWKFYDRARDDPGAAINAFLLLKKARTI